MTKFPLVSIITPVYNSEKFITPMINSVLTQTYINWELILIEDHSTDNSKVILDNFSRQDNRIKVFQTLVNSGAAEARNIGISAAHGKYIAFLDSDDLWHPQKLEIHVSFMLESKAHFSHTSYGYLNLSGNKTKNTFHVSKGNVTYKKLLKRTEISCLTAMYDAEALGKLYMPNIRRKQDYVLWLDILKRGHNSFPLDMKLAWYRQHMNSNTSKKYKLILEHYLLLRDTQNLNVILSLYYTFHWGLNGFIRYKIKLRITS